MGKGEAELSGVHGSADKVDGTADGGFGGRGHISVGEVDFAGFDLGLQLTVDIGDDDGDVEDGSIISYAWGRAHDLRNGICVST